MVFLSFFCYNEIELFGMWPLSGGADSGLF